jgi:hypothetical protein
MSRLPEQVDRIAGRIYARVLSRASLTDHFDGHA